MCGICLRSKGYNNLLNFGLMPSRPSAFDFTLSKHSRTSHCLTHIKLNILSQSGKAFRYLLHVASGTSDCTNFLFRSLTSTWCWASCVLLPIPMFLSSHYVFLMDEIIQVWTHKIHTLQIWWPARVMLVSTWVFSILRCCDRATSCLFFTLHFLVGMGGPLTDRWPPSRVARGVLVGGP